MGEVLSFGFNLAVSFPSDSRGSKACIVLLPSRIKRWGFTSYCLSLFLYIMSSYLRRYSVLYELNTLYACWMAVDVWSNSSRCRQESVYLSQTWCLYTWSYLDILITMLNYVNCSTVICSPTVEYLCSREKPLVKPMAPGSIFIILFSYYFAIYFAFILLCIFIIKIPKILSYHICQISLS